jgi:O-antigen ligase
MALARTEDPRAASKVPLAAIAGGFVVAAVTVALLTEASLVWPVLIMAGIVAVMPTFLVRNPEAYWLVAYLGALIIDMKKLLGDSYEIANRMGFESYPDPSQLSFEIRLADLPFAVLMGFWIWRIVRHQQRIVWPRITWLYVAYLGWFALSTFTSTYPYLGLVELSRQLKFFLVYLWVVNNLDRRDLLRVAMLTLLAVLAVQASFTIARFGLGFRDILGSAIGRVDVVDLSMHMNISEAGGGTGRAWGTVPSPRGTASHLLLLLPLPFFLALRTRDPRARLALVGLVALGVVALLTTFSRAGLMGLLATLPLWAVVAFRWGVLSRRWLFRLVFAAGVAVLAVAPLVGRFLESRPNNVKIRWAQYETARAMILAHPILGVGPGNSHLLQKGFSRYASDLPLDDPLKAAHTEPIHSTHIARVVEFGVIGFLLYLGFFAAIVAIGWRLAGSPDTAVAVGGAALSTGVVALLVQLAADPIVEATLYATLMGFAGMVLALARVDRRRTVPDSAGDT